MKLSLVIFATLLCVGLESQARTVIGSELKEYQDAVLAVLRPRGNTACNNRWNTDVLIRKSQSLEVSSGEQPLLVFSLNNESENGVDLFQVVITTDKDFQRVMSMQVLEFVKGRINSGNLLNPDMHDGYLPKADGVNYCRIN